jgi:DNA-binding NarL/FixJ family response regulator
MPRVFLTCRDPILCEALRNSLQAQGDLVICGEAKSGVEAIKNAMELLPDLVILEKELSPLDGLEVAEALRLIMPDVPVFLVAEENGVEVEKEALACGIDAVFEKDYDFTSLVMNARAACGLT